MASQRSDQYSNAGVKSKKESEDIKEVWLKFGKEYFDQLKLALQID